MQAVSRPDLTRLLLDTRGDRLALLTAPAGYSKSSTLREWEEADPRPFAWIQVHPWHDDPSLLVTSLVEAMEQIAPVAPDVLLALSGPSPDLEGAVLPRLAAALGERDPFVLVLDDVHVLASSRGFRVLAVAIESMPEGAQVAIASRSEPALPLSRLRAQGDLFEIGARELAMNLRESAELLAGIGLELKPHQHAALYERTEGWPAALYLAGLALAGSSDLDAAVDDFAGDDRFVADYVRDEFLASLDPETLAFLTRTSILPRLTAPLCDAALERKGSAAVLRELSRGNVLVIPLDHRDEHYRYHHLFQEMLLSELRRTEPELEPQLHRRAAAFHRERGSFEEAIEHFLAAGDAESGGDLIHAVFPELLGRGRLATVQMWLDQVGPEGVAGQAKLSVVASHLGLAKGDGLEAVRHREAAGAVTTVDGRGDLMLIDATLAPGGVVRMGADAGGALDRFPEDSAWRCAAQLYLGVSRQLQGDAEGARGPLREAVRGGAVFMPLIQVIALSQLALIALESEDLAGASRLLAQAREQVARCGLDDLPGIAVVPAASTLVHALEGDVARAQLQRVHAERLVEQLAEFTTWYEAECRIVLALALIRLGAADEAGAQNGLAARCLERTPDPGVLAEWLERSRSTAAAVALAPVRVAGGLTQAELRTLHYLPSHLTFREIASRIHVSPNTVKTQAQAIYRKLGAASRGEAVDRARDAGLLAENRLIPK